MESVALNVLGLPMDVCCESPLTGYYRDGLCRTDTEDQGRHIVCCEMTEDFLAFSKAAGNDLSTPMPMYQFPGLVPGDHWCLCALRWVEALEQNKAPKIFLKKTHRKILQFVTLDVLKKYALDL